MESMSQNSSCCAESNPFGRFSKRSGCVSEVFWKRVLECVSEVFGERVFGMCFRSFFGVSFWNVFQDFWREFFWVTLWGSLSHFKNALFVPKFVCLLEKVSFSSNYHSHYQSFISLLESSSGTLRIPQKPFQNVFFSQLKKVLKWKNVETTNNLNNSLPKFNGVCIVMGVEKQVIDE